MSFRRFSMSTAIVLSMLCTAASAQTSTWKIDPAHSSSNFAIRHLAVANVRGSIGNVKGTVVLDEKDITKSSVDASLDLNTIDTGVAMRDADLKSPKFFDVARNPAITFKSTAITRSAGKLELVGNLTINGVTKPVTLDLDGPAPPQKQANGKIFSGFSASGVIKRLDFGVGAKELPPAIGDEVKLTIDIQIEKLP